MGKFVRALGALVGVASATALALTLGGGTEPKVSPPSVAVYGALPLSFERNQGQTDSAVDFIARGRDYGIWLKPGETVLALRNHVLRARLVGASRDAAASGLVKRPGKVNYLIGKDAGSWRTGVPTYAKVRYDDVYPGIDQVFYQIGGAAPRATTSAAKSRKGSAARLWTTSRPSLRRLRTSSAAAAAQTT